MNRIDLSAGLSLSLWWDFLPLLFNIDIKQCNLYLQDALRSNLETSIIPAFEMSCKAMFEQIDSTFQKGLVKHTTAIQQQFETAHSPMAIALRVCEYSDIFARE